MDQTDNIKTALSRVQVPILLARKTTDAGRHVLTVHTTEKTARRSIRECIESALAGERIELTTRVKVHRPRTLQRYRSLETLNKRFGDGEIVYDPTHVAGRTEAVVECARRLRAALSDEIEGLFMDTLRRTLFVIVDRSQYPQGGASRDTARGETLKTVTKTIKIWRKDINPDFEMAVRIGFDAPVGARLVSVDRLTVMTTFKDLVRHRLGRRALTAAGASLIGLGVAIPAQAQEPAVSQPNLSVLTRGGWLSGDGFDDDGWAAIGIKGTVPLGQLFGFQLEAGVGTEEYYGAAGHLFYRNPDVGLLGGYASYESMNDRDMTRIGAEAQLYLDMVTLEADLGHQGGDVDNGLFGGLDVSFYATPNFAITGGGDFSDERSLGHIGFEWNPALQTIPGLSIYADAEFGDDDYARVLGGFNIHFGSSRTLLDRDRREDPPPKIFNTIPRKDGYNAPIPPS